MILEPILAKVLSTRILSNAHPDIIKSYGGDPKRHSSLAMFTLDQDDTGYVAVDEATKHSPVDVIFAKSFYAGANHASGKLSGEFMAVLAGSDPDIVKAGLEAALNCIRYDACFYAANDEATIAVFPHVISSLGRYLSKEAGLSPGESMAYLVAPPIEASYAFDAALKAADVSVAKIFPPPTETNFAAMWLSGDLTDCQAAAAKFAETVVGVGRDPI